MLNLQIQHLKTEIAGIEEENAAKRAKLTEDSARARDEDWRGKEEEVELNFDDSSVKRYDCEVGRASGCVLVASSDTLALDFCVGVFCDHVDHVCTPLSES